MQLLGIDYSFARPNLDACAAAGVHAIGRYLWPNTYGSKGINRAEYDAIRARGMGVWYIYEEDGAELTGGYAAGVAAAQRAKSIIASQGLPSQPVFFAIDHNFAGAQLAACVEAVKGAASVLGHSETGIYGGYEHIIAMQRAGACGLFFQTYAWSGGRVAPGVHIYQRLNGQNIGGGSVDLCTIFDAANYGMASLSSASIKPLSEEDDMPKYEIISGHDSQSKFLVHPGGISAIKNTAELKLVARFVQNVNGGTAPDFYDTELQTIDSVIRRSAKG